MTDKTTKRAGRTTRPSTAKTTVRAGESPAIPAEPAASADATASPAPPPQEAAAKTARRQATAKATKTPKAAPAEAARKASAPKATKAAGSKPKKTVATRRAPAPRKPAVAHPEATGAPPSPGELAAGSITGTLPAREEGASPGSLTTDAATGPSLSILVVASEAAPFSRSGGLGDLAGALPAALGALGHSVTLVVPRYSAEPAGVPVDRFAVRLGGHAEEAACYEVALGPNARAILVEHAGFFERQHLYGDGEQDYADNPRRFAFLCRAALEFAARSGERVDVVHAHDWQTALVPVLLRTEYADQPALSGAASVLTIHDIAFQGLFAPEWLDMLGIARTLYSVDGLEFWGRVGFLKGGIVFADVVNTIGKAYARGLVSGGRPSGLEGVLASRGERLLGLVDDEEAVEPGQPPVAGLAERFAGLFVRLCGERGAQAPATR